MEDSVKIRVLVAEDNYVTRLGTVTLLGAQADMVVVGEAEDGSEAFSLYRKLSPDVVVADLRMPTLDGAGLTAALVAEPKPGRVLVLTYYDGDEDVFRALRAGALGYLTKGVRPGELVTAVRTVAAGQRYVPNDIAARLAERIVAPALTPRELQVLDSIYRGMANKEISAALGMAERTVSMHVSSVLAKLGARSRTDAVGIAIARGILQTSHR